MKIINIVDSVAKVNLGIWNSAVSTAHILKQAYSVDSELWYPKPVESLPDTSAINGCTLREIGTFDPKDVLDDQCILVSHGCWQLPTRYAHSLHRQHGTPWMYVPHGMLEPWSLMQNRIKKMIYFTFIERRFANCANVVRAVGSPEAVNLSAHFSNPIHIPNGVDLHHSVEIKDFSSIRALFMARLHHKKGIIPLVRAWKQSTFGKSKAHSLTIAGPNDGELEVLMSELVNTTNITYVGAVYGEHKQKLLNENNCYLLPSYSEGFPTSVVEAMGNGLVPLISEGCNFPEAFEMDLGLKISPNVPDIVQSLEKLGQLNNSELQSLSIKNTDFIRNLYILEKIAEKQYDIFTRMLTLKTHENRSVSF